MIRDITGVSPSNIEPTILKLNKPTVNQFIQPIIANTNAIFLIISGYFMANKDDINLTKI